VRRALRLCAAACLACAVPAAADDDVPTSPDEEVPAPTDESQPTLHGEIRAGWRLLSGEHEGRFPQDVALKDGPRIFELDLVGTDPRPDAGVDEMEMHLSGVGDGASDYLLTLRKRHSFDLSGGYRRDSYDYVASGDPFPYDSVRERSFVHALWTPDGDTAVRVTWDRNDRRGHAATYGYGKDSLTFDAPNYEPRSFTDESDRFSLGGDYGVGIFRFGLTQTVGLTGVHEQRAFDADRTTELSVRSKAFTTAGKVGASLADGDLDVTLFAVRTTGPTDDRAIFREATPETHAFTGEVDRRAMTWRLEAAWRPWRDWEFTVAAEKFDLVDETSGDDTTSVVPTVPPTKPLVVGDVEHRERRASVDATWDAADELRLRLGEEVLREELYVPADSHFSPHGESDFTNPTDLSSNTFRTTAGADWRPSKKVSLAATAHFAVNNDPQTTAAPRDSDDWTARGRWKPSDELALTTVWRRQVFDHSGSVDLDQIRSPTATPSPVGSTDLDSTSRSSSVSQSVAWTRGPWSVHGTGTYRRLDTTSDSAYYGASGNALEDVGWSGRVVIVDVGVRYEVTQTFRVFGDAVRSNARDDMETSRSGKTTHVGYPARRLDVSGGAEYDFGADIETDAGPRKNMTVGVTVSSWRLVDGESPGDSFRAYGVEFSVAYRF